MSQVRDLAPWKLAVVAHRHRVCPGSAVNELLYAVGHTDPVLTGAGSKHVFQDSLPNNTRGQSIQFVRHISLFLRRKSINDQLFGSVGGWSEYAIKGAKCRRAPSTRSRFPVDRR